MGPANRPCADGRISWATAGGRGGVAVVHDGREGGVGRVKWGGCWCDRSTRVGVATRLARVGQGDPMAASGHGHVLGVDMDKVKGCLVCSFGKSGRRGVVVAAG